MILSKLYTIRYLILLIMVLSALSNEILRFWGVWEHFYTAGLGHILFGQAVFAYTRGGTVRIGPGGIDKDGSPIGRAVLGGAAFLLFCLTFFYPFY